MASLAIVNPESAYLSQGAFCTLPIQPFWCRLALAWIPRYLVAAIIVSLAATIYAYVGFEFRSCTSLGQSIQTPVTSTALQSHKDRDIEAANDTHETIESEPKNMRRASSIAHDVVASQRRGSAVVLATERNTINRVSTLTAAQTQSLPGSSTQLPLKHNLSVRPPLFVIPLRYSVKPRESPTSLRGGALLPIIHQPEDPLATVTAQASTKTRHPPANPRPHHLQLAISNANECESIAGCVSCSFIHLSTHSCGSSRSSSIV